MYTCAYNWLYNSLCIRHMHTYMTVYLTLYVYSAYIHTYMTVFIALYVCSFLHVDSFLYTLFVLQDKVHVYISLSRVEWVWFNRHPVRNRQGEWGMYTYITVYISFTIYIFLHMLKKLPGSACLHLQNLLTSRTNLLTSCTRLLTSRTNLLASRTNLQVSRTNLLVSGAEKSGDVGLRCCKRPWTREEVSRM